MRSRLALPLQGLRKGCISPVLPSTASQPCHEQQGGDSCSWQHLSLLSSFCSFHSALLLIYFKVFLSLCIIFAFPFAPLLFFHPFSLHHHLLSVSPSLSCSLPLLPLPTPPSKQGNHNPKEEQELNLCQHNGPRGYIWNQQITEP